MSAPMHRARLTALPVVTHTDYDIPAQAARDDDVVWTAVIADVDGLLLTFVGSDPHDAVVADKQPLVSFTRTYVTSASIS
jgi:hypothetical protein